VRTAHFTNWEQLKPAFCRFAFLNGHRGNRASLEVLATELYAKLYVSANAIVCWDLVSEQIKKILGGRTLKHYVDIENTLRSAKTTGRINHWRSGFRGCRGRSGGRIRGALRSPEICLSGVAA
jgi:hypothetical protein